MSDKANPTSAADQVKRANEDANRQFNGDKPSPSAKLPELDDDVTKANHAANAEFNGGEAGEQFGNTVGALRGPSD